MLLGVDAVREFNVQRDSYSAEFGKHPGGQVIIVTQSGSNQWHGAAYEFLRNNALDAPNFFDQGSAPPFQRNQFGASVGGPLHHDKTFVFANYEGFRQNLHQTSAAFVPDNASRAAAVPSVQPFLNLWPIAPAGAPDFTGIAEVFSSPLQTIREDFGTVRVDHTFSQKDSLSAIYTIDDGGDLTATPVNPYSSDILNLREQVVSLEETHVFSPTLLNTARVGYSRAGYFFTGEPTPGTPAASVPGFLAGLPVGAAVVGGSAASNPQASIGLAGSNNGSNLHIARNIYTYEDRVTLTQRAPPTELRRVVPAISIQRKHRAQPVWTGDLFQPHAVSERHCQQLPLRSRADADATGAPGSARSTPRTSSASARKLTLSLGFRNEFSTGWNEAHGRAANYIFTNGMISSTPMIGSELFTQNRAKALPQPRIAMAWSPVDHKTVIRAGFGMYNDLQDALGYRADQNAPFNPVYNLAALPVSKFPIDTTAPVPTTAKLVPGGVQPDMKTPTLISWSLRVEREISPNTSVTVGYVGSHGYHELIGIDANEPTPVICPASPCPAVYPTWDPSKPTTATNSPNIGFPDRIAFCGRSRSRGNLLHSRRRSESQSCHRNTWTWFSEGVSSYHALEVDVRRRFSRGLSLRGVYTFSKALDDGDSLNQTTAGNAPGLAANPLNLRADKGLATFDASTHRRGQRALRSTLRPRPAIRQRFRRLARRPHLRLVALEHRHRAIRLPLYAAIELQPNKHRRHPKSRQTFPESQFLGPGSLGQPQPVVQSQRLHRSAFHRRFCRQCWQRHLHRSRTSPLGISRVLKDTKIRERLSLQFRAEIFNLLDRANFNTPNLIVFTPPTATNPTGLSGTAGAITSTSTTSRQVQFGLKLLW